MKTINTLRQVRRWLCAAALSATAASAQAALISLGDGTVKDTNTNLIWLQNWNVNGSTANWNASMTWAEGLNFAGSSDWALPSFDEFEALFTAYGNLTLVSAFSNVQSGYWSSSVAIPGTHASAFFTDDGSGAAVRFEFPIYSSVAVRPADTVGTVAEPQVLSLALLAIAAGWLMSRKRSA